MVIFLFVFSLGTKLLGWFIFFFLNDEKQSSGFLGWLSLLDLNAMYLILLSIYYYIFEVTSVFININFIIPQVQKERLKQNRIAKVSVLSSYFILQIALTVLYIPSINEYYKENIKHPLSITLWVIKGLQLAIDMGMLFIFIFLFVFFTKQKYRIFKTEHR